MEPDHDNNRITTLTRGRRLVLAAAMVAAAPATAGIQAHIVAASDYVVQGVSQTLGDPALQGGVSYSHRSGVFAGVWLASNKLIPSRYYDDRRINEVDYYAGWQGTGDNGIAWTAALSHYTYPDEGYYSRYRYDELTVSAGLENGVSATLGVSDNLYNEGDAGGFVELAYERAVSGDVVLNAGAGYYDASRVFGHDYGYWSAGVTKLMGRFALDLNYIDTQSDAARIYGDEATGSRWVLSLTATLF